MRLLLQSDSKRALRKLLEINITASGCTPQTPFQTLYGFIKSEVTKPKHLEAYLSAMRSSEISCQSMLKFCVFVHIYVQNDCTVDVEPLQQFLGHLLQRIPQLIQKYQANQIKRNKSSDKYQARSKTPKQTAASCNNSPIGSSRSETQLFVCKEVYLLTHVVKPYIAYLLKLFSSQDELIEIQMRWEGPHIHDAWRIVNYLKLLSSATNGFTYIGRYFLSNYGHLVVLLTRTLSRDINKMLALLSRFVLRENQRMTTHFQQKQKAIDEFVGLLEQIAELNDNLYTLFLGKYFVRFLLDLPEPKWIIPTSREFDAVYKAQKMKLNRQENVGKKRSISSTCSNKKEAFYA